MYKHIHTHIYICLYIYSHIHTYPLYPFIHIHCIHSYISIVSIHTYMHTYIRTFTSYLLSIEFWSPMSGTHTLPSLLRLALQTTFLDLSGVFLIVWRLENCLSCSPFTLACFFLGTALISPLLRFAQVTDWSRNRTDISTYYGIAFCPLIIIHSPILILRACWMATQDRVVVVVISCWPEQVHIPNDVEVPVAKWS